MRVKTAIAKILKMEGVECVFGFPTNPLFDACAAEGIRCILFRNEHVATQAAIGFSRASFGERIGVVVVQEGPGIQMAFPGIRAAYSDSVPILILPRAEERRRITTDPYFDAASVFRPVTKWSEIVNFAERTPEIMRRAFTCLRMGKPRPVLVDVPKDVMNEEFLDELFQYRQVKRVNPAGDPDLVREAARMLLSAKFPILRAGQGVLYARAWEELRELAEYLQIPVTTTLNGKSAFPENHPLYAGAGARGHRGTVPHFLNKADIIFAIGSSCTNDFFIYPIPRGKALVQITLDERDINKDYPVDMAIIGDARLVLRQLLDEIKKQTNGNGRPSNDALIQEIKAVNSEWLNKWFSELTSDEVPIHPYRLYWDVMKALDPSKTIITHDSGTPRDCLTAFWETPEPGGFIGYGKDHTLGAGMGQAMGAKLARPGKTVVHIGGDGAFGEVGMDWETAVREKIAIIEIVLNNGKLGIGKNESPLAYERYQFFRLTGNYSKIAEAFGSKFERVEKPGDIIPAVQRAKKTTDLGMPYLIEVMSRAEVPPPIT